MLRFMSLALLAALAASAHAATYRWTDQQGKVHYSDTPPPASARSVQKKEASGIVVESPTESYATQQAMKNFPVTLYIADSCGAPCNDAKAFLQKRGVPFKEVAIVDEATREELKKISGGVELPVLTIGRDVKRGWAESMYGEALDTAGYPSAALPTVPRPALKAQPKPPAAPMPVAPPPKGRYSP